MSQLSKKEAIDYIYSVTKGSLDDLKNTIGNEHVEALQLTGLIKRGQEVSHINSWAITKTAISLVESFHERKDKTITDKIIDYINYFIMRKNLKIAA